ncbi:ABC transporter permease [Thermomonospora catenispora]|uniref:ABC transporter permease n=1 Tax=Thermomonospora catenispora TaxID=2493090 RepID=UPI00111F498B|nr:ABC transporter permease [Thermomonospora catenispora]TNY38575.1 FtsX-like permease family protein [Thermomonospora catenispora]
MSLGGHRAALRIAWRDAWRAKGRSALVLCMIGLPVLAIVMLAVLDSTREWSAVERLPHELGRAEARVQFAGGPIRQDVLGESWIRAGDTTEPVDASQVARLVTARFGPSARVVPYVTGDTQVRTPRGYAQVEVRELDLRDRITTGILTVTAGRPPASADEVAISPALRDRGYRIGDTIILTRDDTPKRIVGHVVDPDGAASASFVQTLPGSGLIAPQHQGHAWLLSTGRPVTWSDVEHFNRSGLVVASAELIRNPPAGVGVPNGSGRPPAEKAVLALTITMIVLEVVLLAGPAFAVGIRRQRRQLALVMAAGGQPRHLRAIVLAGGAAAGAVAALLGASAGLGLAAVAVPIIDRHTDAPMGPFEVPWPLVAVPMALGALSGLLAAYVPAAQAARMDVVAALAGRRERVRARRGWPIAGAVCIAGGAALCLVGPRLLAEYGIVFGTAAIVVGGVLVCPLAVGVAARPARSLPLPLRLAVRDNARNRGRAAPAVAAIMAAVAGITALAIGGSSEFAWRRANYQPELPMGAAYVSLTAEHADRVRRAIEQELPGVPIHALHHIGPFGDCDTGCRWLNTGVDPQLGPFGTLVAEPDAVRMLLGREDPQAVRTLREGGVVLPEGRTAPGGRLRAQIMEQRPPDANGTVPQRVLRTVDLPVATVAERLPGEFPALVSPRTARELGLPTALTYYAIDRADHRVTPAEQERVNERIAGALPEDVRLELYVERGFTGSFATPLVLLALAGGVMVVGGSLIVTGLAVADARPDLATLAAVGARPRTRRLLTMGQAACTALLGCWLGIAAGLAPGISAARVLTRVPGTPIEHDPPPGGVQPIVDIPWSLLAAVGLLVPVLAALAAGLFTRSRLPVVRRIA